MKINNVYGSRYLKEFRKLATERRYEILILQELFFEWIKFQKNYIYLESIFSQPEIKKNLINEHKIFEERVNKIYKSNIKKINMQPIASFTRSKQKYAETFLSNLKESNEVL